MPYKQYLKHAYYFRCLRTICIPNFLSSGKPALSMFCCVTSSLFKIFKFCQLNNAQETLLNISTKIQINLPIDNAMNRELKAVLNAHSKCYAFSLTTLSAVCSVCGIATALILKIIALCKETDLD